MPAELRQVRNTWKLRHQLVELEGTAEGLAISYRLDSPLFGFTGLALQAPVLELSSRDGSPATVSVPGRELDEGRWQFHCGPELLTHAQPAAVVWDARLVLAAYGLTEKDIHPEYLKPGPSGEKMRDNSLDAYFFVGGFPAGAIVELAATTGITLVPLKLYEKKGRIKLELGVARGKRQYDKRVAIADREAKRDIERAIRDRQR